MDAAQLDWGPIDIGAFFKTQADASGVRTQHGLERPSTAGNEKRQRLALMVMLGGITLVIVAAFAML
jgi:hypothetical protein